MKTEVVIGGVTYYLSRLDTNVLEKFIKWADESLPDPVQEAKKDMEGFPPEIQIMLVKNAIEQRSLRRSGQSDDFRSLLSSPKGARKLIGLLFAKFQPSLSETEVAALIAACEEEHGIEHLKAALDSCSTSAAKPSSK